jgi:hypothetical protein
MGASEVADVENRARWQTCVERHSAWLACSAVLIEKGLLAPPEATK